MTPQHRYYFQQQKQYHISAARIRRLPWTCHSAGLLAQFSAVTSKNNWEKVTENFPLIRLLSSPLNNIFSTGFCVFSLRRGAVPADILHSYDFSFLFIKTTYSTYVVRLWSPQHEAPSAVRLSEKNICCYAKTITLYPVPRADIVVTYLL